MALIRGHHAFDDHFAQIPNDWLRDGSISLEARGLLAQIMSHRPGWKLSIKSIAYQNSIGKTKVKRILDELMDAGYLERSEKQAHDENGHLAGFDYTTRDPHGGVQEPYKAGPYKAEPVKDSEPPKKTISQKTNFKEEHLEELFDQFWSIYPNKKDKRGAKTEFERALKRTEFETLIDGATRYRDDPNRDPGFTKHPKTWLHNDAWDNDPEPVRDRGGAGWVKPTAAQRTASLYAKYKAIEDAEEEPMKGIGQGPDFSSMLKRVD
jgi:hypothetical protein